MLITREMVLQQDIGLNGTLFGGDMMARMDKASGIFAGLQSRNGRFVTLKVSELIFHSPVRAGEMIEFTGTLGRRGRTSLSVLLEVWVFNPVTEARREVTSGEFLMVAVDDAGTPEPILWKPELTAQGQP
jgi:acyl-CoA thioesterase YciA